MGVQTDINNIIDDMATKMIDASQHAAESLEDEIDKIRIIVRDLLDENTNVDGTVSKQKLRKLLRDLDNVETEVLDSFEDKVTTEVDKVSKDAESKLTEALTAALGASLLYGGVKNKPNKSDIMSDINEYMFNTEIGGVKMADRLRSTAGFLRDDIQRAIRYGVNQNESVTDISKRIKKTFEDTSWRFKRVVNTEIPLAFRLTIAKVGDKTNAIKAIKIVDNRGRHANHEKHKCYIYAEKDPYGMGKGVYKPSDTHILSPHPQCTAYYHYILKDDVINKVDE